MQKMKDSQSNHLDGVWELNNTITPRELDAWIKEINKSPLNQITMNSDATLVRERFSKKDKVHLKILITCWGSGVNHWNFLVLQKIKTPPGKIEFKELYYVVGLMRFQYVSDVTYQVKSNRIVVLGAEGPHEPKFEMGFFNADYHFM